MGVDLTNDKGNYLRFSNGGWTLALCLAEVYEWEQEGTTLEQEEGEEPIEWDGDYFSSDGQRVTPSDAVGLATACERALADPEYEETAAEINDQIDAAIAEADPEWEPQKWSREDYVAFRDQLKELITFCREGGFIIE
jgi:hypothetical protein